MPDRVFEVTKASWTKMASTLKKTQFGNLTVPPTEFKESGSEGLKFLIVSPDARRTIEAKYVLRVPGGNVVVMMSREYLQPFDETAIEPLFASVRVDQAGKPTIR